MQSFLLAIILLFFAPIASAQFEPTLARSGPIQIGPEGPEAELTAQAGPTFHCLTFTTSYTWDIYGGCWDLIFSAPGGTKSWTCGATDVTNGIAPYCSLYVDDPPTTYPLWWECDSPVEVHYEPTTNTLAICW